MAIVRTIFWVLLAVALVLFAVYNWDRIVVLIWPTLVLETPLPALVISAFLLGLVPMWALHRTTRWRLRRRIAGLEAMLARPNTIAPNPQSEALVPPPIPPA